MISITDIVPAMHSFCSSSCLRPHHNTWTWGSYWRIQMLISLN